MLSLDRSPEDRLDRLYPLDPRTRLRIYNPDGVKDADLDLDTESPDTERPIATPDDPQNEGRAA